MCSITLLRYPTGPWKHTATSSGFHTLFVQRSVPDSQRYAPVLRPDTLVSLMAPCQNTLRSLALPSGRSLTCCGREEASFAGWVDAAFGGGLGGTLRSLTIRSLAGLSLGALHRILGHLPALEHFSVTFHPPDEGAAGPVLAMLCPACPRLRTLHFGTVRRPSSRQDPTNSRESFSCAQLAGCPELVDLTMDDIPVDVASLNAVLPFLPCLQVLKAPRATGTVFGRPIPLDFSLMPHPDRLRALAHPSPSVHFELLTGLEESVGCLHERVFAELALHLRRAVLPDSWGGLPVSMPRLVEFAGPAVGCPPDARCWETLERATLYANDRTPEIRLFAPRLRHLAVLRGPGPETLDLRQLEAPLLESLDLCVEDRVARIGDLHCPALRSLTLRDYRERLPSMRRLDFAERFDQLQTLIIEHHHDNSRNYPISALPIIRAALALVPNLTTLKGIALVDPTHLPLLSDLCSGAMLPHLTHLDAITTTGPTGLQLQCSPVLRVLTLRFFQAHPQHILRIEGPSLVRLHLKAKQMPPLAVVTPRLRDCHLETRASQPCDRWTAPDLRRLTFECHTDSLSTLAATLACLPALSQLRLVVPWLPAVVPQILDAAHGHPLIDLTLLVRGPAKTLPLEVTLPPWVRSLVVTEKAVEVRLHAGAGLESIDVARATKLSLSAEGAWPNLVWVTGDGERDDHSAFGLPAGSRRAFRFWRPCEF
ncbi:hypothetical protein PAPYR_9377 [Paratrimastix pyriformis]|uniref:Uncharacterized protein n=1 Tax=Paratrimastix pyriformis TaxID=342808 RepID=A0ABQ8U8H6_9EUKA|nr:hypothetical protein PAPYR_9377 [Paratrimastix pyriformis]